MTALAVGIAMIVGGVLAATRSLWIVRRAVRVWPRPIARRDTDRFLTSEFLLRYVGLLTAAAGLGLLISSLV